MMSLEWPLIQYEGVLIRRDQGIDTHIEERPREDTGRRQSAAS